MLVKNIVLSMMMLLYQNCFANETLLEKQISFSKIPKEQQTMLINSMRFEYQNGLRTMRYILVSLRNKYKQKMSKKDLFDTLIKECNEDGNYNALYYKTLMEKFGFLDQKNHDIFIRDCIKIAKEITKNIH